MVRDASPYSQSSSDRPAKAGPAAHFHRNEKYAYFGDRTPEYSYVPDFNSFRYFCISSLYSSSPLL